LFNGVRYGAAILGCLFVIVLAQGVGGAVYQVQHLIEPAYRILPRPEPYVDRATLQRNWPSGLGESRDRATLVAYMTHIPETGAEVEGPTSTRGPAVELPLPTLLAQADVAKGERVAAKCKSCHTLEQGGRNGQGPNLWNVVGRPRAQHPGFDYSDGLRQLGGEWSYDSLFEYLKNPKGYVEGSAMNFVLRKAEDRANLLVYLRTLSDSPVPLPQPVTAQQ